MKVISVASACVLLGAGMSSAGAARLGSGLYGVAKKSPTMPVCRSDQTCSSPAKNVVLLFTRFGRIVAKTKTGHDGRYRLRLAAGTYGVRLTTSSPVGRGLSPRQVRVPRHRLARVDFTIDTGIR